MLRTLIDERGPWSANPFPNDIVTHWKLDKTEDTWRRRQKLRKNYHFDRKLCHPSSTLPTTGAIPSATETKSGFAAHIPQQMKQFLLKGIRRITDESFLDSVEFDAESSELKASDSEDLSERQPSEGSKVDIDIKDLHERKDHSSTSTSTSVESEDSEVCELTQDKTLEPTWNRYTRSSFRFQLYYLACLYIHFFFQSTFRSSCLFHVYLSPLKEN